MHRQPPARLSHPTVYIYMRGLFIAQEDATNLGSVSPIFKRTLNRYMFSVFFNKKAVYVSGDAEKISKHIINGELKNKN